jgi:CHASE3 domain sensor protein
MLTNYFSKLSREERELLALKNHQEGRLRNEAKAEETKQEVARNIERKRIAQQVIEIIDSDDSRDIGDQVRDTFQLMAQEVNLVCK